MHSKSIINNNFSNDTSIWNLLCCCCGKSAKNGNPNHDRASEAANAVIITNEAKNDETKDQVNEQLQRHHKETGESRSLPPPSDIQSSLGTPRLDQLTVTTATQPRSHFASTNTHTYTYSARAKGNYNDQTILPGDVRLWDEPFGKDASGQIFNYKAVYLPLCQVITAIVVYENKLDNQNVKQMLLEFRDLQESLPDCDQLMKIFGWYRDLEKNAIVIALEYMDIGSVYDSCFPNPKKLCYKPKKSKDLPNTAEQQEKTGHKQIIMNKLTYDQIRFIARECLVGLNALHSCNFPLVHRDIKPQNILLSSFGDVKISDFGFLEHVFFNTQSGQGTKKYFSPERINKNYGTKCDIWALGITLIEIYHQELIPPDELDCFKLVDEGIDIGDFIEATAPTEFVDFLKKCLNKNEKNRPNAKQLLNHRFVTRGWGNALDDHEKLYLRRKKLVTFADLEPDPEQKILDKMLRWLELWILADKTGNARIFSQSEPQYLEDCVHNLAVATSNTPEFIERYMAESYKERLNTDT